MMKFFLTATFVGLTLVPAQAATFILDYTIGEIAGLTSGVSKAILVADTSGDGFAGISDPNTNNTTHFDLSSFSLTAGSVVGDDLAIWAATAIDLGGGKIGFDFGTQSFDTSNSLWGGLLGTNQRLAVYWFPSGSNTASSAFGYYRTDAVEGGNRGYFTPLDGGTNSIVTTTPSLGGTTTPAAISANNGTISAVPEPSRVLFLALGMMSLALRRRR